MTTRPLDVICLGRAAVDLYGQQLGGRFEDVQSFAKSLGGSSGNLAAGLARLGVRSAMLTRVGDEAMGRFVREALAAEGVDVTHIHTDPHRLTGLVLLGIAGPDAFPHIFFRENCADMAVSASDFDEDWIGSARSLAISGTHLSTEGTRKAVHAAVSHARARGTRVILDIDYRPVLWGLTSPGDGASRFAASTAATAALEALLPHCELVVGTEEELAVAGGTTDAAAALSRVQELSRATIVVKHGPAGCTIHPPGRTPVRVPGFPVSVLNTLGAGDAFLAGFLSAWLRNGSAEECGRIGNACGALVVSRHGCTPAMPAARELADYLERSATLARPDLDDRLAHRHLALTTRRPRPHLYVLAFDHRRQLETLAAGYGTPLARIARFKQLVATAFGRVAASSPHPERLGVIVDDRYGAQVLPALTHAGHWIGRAIEVPGSSPVEFESGQGPATQLLTWPSRHVIKCLVLCHPEDPLEERLAQEARVVDLHRAAAALERELLLEIVVRHTHAVDENTTARIVQRFYNVGVRPAWWKLEPQSAPSWSAISRVIGTEDPDCNGILLLGLDAPEERLRLAFETAASHPLCRGFAVGRSIFGHAARAWLGGNLEDEDVIEDIASRYQRLIGLWRAARPG